MNRIRYSPVLIVSIWLTLLTAAGHARGAAPERPNVVLIMTDNHGAWTLGCYGNPDVRTPHVDRLAREGMLFSRCYSSNPVCSPTRATWLTGLMPSQHGVHCFIAGSVQIGPEAFSTLEEFRSLPEVLAEAGYTCGLSGKWHLGKNLQPQEGFTFWTTKPGGGTAEFYDQQVIENGTIRKERTYLTDYWTTRGIEFIEANKDRPFFLFLAYNGPYGLSTLLLNDARNRHAAYYADRELPSFPREEMHPWLYNNRDYLNNPTSIRRYAAEISGIDDGVGRIMATLSKQGLDENTLVVFTADQGLAGGQSGIWGMGDHTRPLSAFDTTMHVPLILRHPKRIPAGARCDLLVSNYDFYPSVLGYLGLEDKIPDEPRSPGRSYAAVLEGAVPDRNWDNTVFYEFETVRAVRTDKWKYVERLDGGPRELYDLAHDPGELRNLADRPAVRSTQHELRGRLHAFFERYADPKYDLAKGGTTKAQFLISQKPAVVRASYVDRSFTLDATTVQLHGQHVKLLDDLRTIAGWKGPEDRAVWSLARVRPGKYEIQAEWSLAGSEGTFATDRLAIEIDGASIGDQLAVSGQDRVGTTGGRERFQSFRLGQIDLPAGDHQLTFRPAGELQGRWIRLRWLKLVPVSD
jgi:arylsulfatase A-like enzyme